MTTPVAGAPDRSTSVLQDVVRLLLLISVAAEPLGVPRPPRAPDDAVAVVESQVRLQKLDFWVRNPDYLANELLSRYEDGGDPADLHEAERILLSEEPEVRSYRMLRHLFGAYEELDEALALLATPRLVLQRRRHGGERARTDYYLTADGARAAERAVRQAQSLNYYVDRTRLVLDLADGRRGGQLRDVQYLQQEYRDAAHGSQIGGIAGRARARLQAVLARQASGEEAS